MQGPGPVNVGGTGRKRKPGRAVTACTVPADSRQAVGKLGEDTALEYLLRDGFKLLERNWRCRYKEIDLILADKDGLHIVEVKTRTLPLAADPEQAVDRCKQANLEAAASAYLRMRKLDCDIHFDIMSVVLEPEGGVRHIRFIRDAFLPIKDRRQDINI